MQMIVDMPLLLFLFILVTMALTFFTRLPNKRLLVLLFFIPFCFFEAFFILPWIWQVSGLEHFISYYTRIEIAFPKIVISDRTFDLIFFALFLFILIQLSIGLHELIHHKQGEKT